MKNIKNVLIVCGGNTCRSPMAKVILEQMLKSKGLDGQFKVDSVAYRGTDGSTAHTNARQTIKELFGEDLLANHVPKKLTKAMVDETDLIIVMEDYMKASLPASKVIVLEIADPYGPNIQKYRTSATDIQHNLQKNWPYIVGLSTTSQNTATQLPVTASKVNRTEFSKDFGELLKKHYIQPRTTPDWVYNEVIKIAEKVDFGRGEHAKTVTRLMLNIYSEMARIGLINDDYDKHKLAEIIGLAHDIGVGKEQPGEGHNGAGWRILKEEVWKETLSSDQKNLLAIVMYGIFYHRDKILDGKLKALNDIPLHDYRDTAELVSIIRIADGLDYGLVKGSPDKIEKIEMARTSKGVECRVFPRSGKNVTELVAKSLDKREVFESTFGKLTFCLPGDNGGWIPWQL
ncbi:MAG: hypothetical protein ABR886_11070 [Dehalococcoidales bacterium]